MMSSVDSRRPLRRDLLVRARELICKERPHSERFTLGFARDRSDLIEVQRLRYRVFAGEMGARLDCPIPGIDADLFDMYCDHLGRSRRGRAGR